MGGEGAAGLEDVGVATKAAAAEAGARLTRAQAGWIVSMLGHTFAFPHDCSVWKRHVEDGWKNGGPTLCGTGERAAGPALLGRSGAASESGAREGAGRVRQGGRSSSSSVCSPWEWRAAFRNNKNAVFRREVCQGALRRPSVRQCPRAWCHCLCMCWWSLYSEVLWSFYMCEDLCGYRTSKQWRTLLASQ